MEQELEWINDSLCVKFFGAGVIYILIQEECLEVGMETMTAIGLLKLMAF